MATADSQHKRRKLRHPSEHDFVSSPPDFFQTECSICLVVLRSPHLTSCCGHNFCKECIGHVQKVGKCCPLCNKKNFTLVYNRAHDVSLKQLEVYCTHRKFGCTWKGKLEMLNKHLNVDPELEKQLEGCGFVAVLCSRVRCGQSFQRGLLSKHQSRECPQRPYSCVYCREYESTYHDVTTKHCTECKCFPVSCPNSCAMQNIERQNLEKHLNEVCPLQEVECEFKNAGCETKLPRKDMPKHLSNSKEMVCHMSLLARENQRLAQQNTELSGWLKKLGDHIQIAPTQIVFPDFEQHKRDKDAWYSEGFYTHPQGYRMCLRVDANGCGDEGSHVSCFVYLKQGRFDNQLKWPFRGDVAFQLLNQRENRTHRSMTLSLNDDTPEEVTARVTSQENATRVGWGYDVLIPHSELGYNASTNCQYLMNDSLHFRVQVILK